MTAWLQPLPATDLAALVESLGHLLAAQTHR
jgi:hypothetical protein